MDKIQAEALRENIKAKLISGASPHGSNISHQLSNIKKLSAKKVAALDAVCPKYLEFISDIDTLMTQDEYPDPTVARDILETYLANLRQPEINCFDSVTDFFTSAAPEFFLRLYHRMIEILDLDLYASGQKDIPIELAFDPSSASIFIPRFQRVDIAILKNMTLVADENPLEEFCIPVYVAESKTYFDKNMISGVAYSATSLKTTFPRCICVSVGEWSDFDLKKQSFAGTSINEIYVLRNQKRANFRSTGTIQPISTDTMRLVIFQVWELLKSYEDVHPRISDRLHTGKLIN